MAWLALYVLLSTPSSSQLPDPYEAVRYATAPLDDAVARLQKRVDTGETSLSFSTAHGYLPALLQALGIPSSSQTLVFTKTSVQVGRVSPETPRALYFTDDAYVAWVQGGESLEISSLDPELGAVFYTLRQEELARPRFERQTFACLRCHDSYSLTGGGVPRHIMGSAIPDENGQPAFHEGWYFTDDRTPLEKRWGGWYVTGTHGEQRHLGNLIVEDAAAVQSLDRDSGANVTDLGELVDTAPYLVKHSDIVALMVLEHQVRVQNVMTRVRYETRSAIAAERELDLETVVEPLVAALLLTDEAPLRAKITGTSGFTAAFEKRGPFDSRGRSLRELNLETRLFEHPLSYLVYSQSFDALPEAARDYVYRRLRDVLEGSDPGTLGHRLSPAQRSDILRILEETKADFP